MIENNILTEYVGNDGDVVVPEGVTHIGNVFSEAEYYGLGAPNPLKSIVLPKSMISIDWNAFNYCQFLSKFFPQILSKRLEVSRNLCKAKQYSFYCRIIYKPLNNSALNFAELFFNSTTEMYTDL